MDVSYFDFHLPEELIAQKPLPERSSSRLLVLHRQDGRLEHRQFSDWLEYVRPGDVWVVNDTRVRPARLTGMKEETGARVELLLLKPLGEGRWEALVKPAKRVKTDTVLLFGDGLLRAVAEEQTDVAGGRVFRLEHGAEDLEPLLNQLGEMPLPPYIREQLDEPERYQTVYSREVGSAAAPTAGLHFTQELLDQARQRGAQVVPITLHVGLGTFRPVTTDRIEDHRMHSEYYEVSAETANVIREAKRTGNRVCAVGTTSVRTLESVMREHGAILPCNGWTDIFIYPGFSFQVVDALVTNFHLPRSTLLMLISAFATREQVLHAYQEAVEKRYRFFSFGDAMLIV
jgi:S-adenosylmethionine:tRNA ribosyltransferase-isomerase